MTFSNYGVQQIRDGNGLPRLNPLPQFVRLRGRGPDLKDRRIRVNFEMKYGTNEKIVTGRQYGTSLSVGDAC